MITAIVIALVLLVCIGAVIVCGDSSQLLDQHINYHEHFVDDSTEPCSWTGGPWA